MGKIEIQLNDGDEISIKTEPKKLDHTLKAINKYGKLQLAFNLGPFVKAEILFDAYTEFLMESGSSTGG